MARLILTLLFTFLLVSLVASPFEEGLDAAVDQIVGMLKSPKTDCLVVASVVSSDDGQVYYPDLDSFMAQRISDRLANVCNVKVIGFSEVKPILDSKFKKFKLPSDYKTYQALLQQLYQATNKTGNVFLAASIIPDTETGLSSAVFTGTFTLYNPNTATKIGQKIIPIPMDKFSDNMLGITRQDEVSVTKSAPVEVVEKPAPVAPIDNSVTTDSWFEDFSTFAIGDQLTAWGKDAFVFEGTDKRHYLSSESSEKYFTNFQIRFPQDFTFKFDFIGSNFDGNLMLCDINDKEFTISFGRIWGKNCFVSLASNKPSEIAGRDINTLRFEKKGTALKVFINGEFAQSADSSDLGALRSFKFKIPGKVQFTNFSLIPYQ